jgi:hypothetical protein
MNLTNTLGLPDALVEAVRNDAYSPGSSDITATQLIGAPRLRLLLKRHGEGLTEDASDRIWSLMGQAVHAVLQRAGGDELASLRERRLYGDVGGVKVGGQFDHLDLRNGTLSDYKTCSVWAVVLGDKPEWEAQLNVLAWLCRLNGHEVKALEIVAILRDWSKRDAGIKADYPQAQVARIKVPLWDHAEAARYVAERVKLHVDAALMDEPPPCSASERWEKPTTWAAMKPGAKRALRVLPDEAALKTWIATEGPNVPRFDIVKRPGESTRCKNYCAALPVCKQGQALTATTTEEPQ